MKKFLLVLISVFLSSCASVPKGYKTVGKPTRNLMCPDYSQVEPGFYGGNGSSVEEAVEAVGLDYNAATWINGKYPGSKLVLQELVIPPKSKLKYDHFVFKTKAGEEKEVWFWISGGLDCLF